MQGMGHSQDQRTVILSEDDRRNFLHNYTSNLEEGWCLYGSINETHIVIDDVVHSSTTDKQSDRISFSCIPETVQQLTDWENPRLIGDVHSHPDRSKSRLSRGDIHGWALVGPLVKVKGVYTVGDGAEFFTVQSLSTPLDKRVVEP